MSILTEPLDEEKSSAAAPVLGVAGGNVYLEVNLKDKHGSEPKTPLWTLKAMQFLIFGANVCLLRYITVYYDAIGLTRDQMGLLLVILPMSTFVGNMFWGTVVDHVGEFKRTLVSTSVGAILVVFLYLLPAVRQSLPLLMIVTALHGFMTAPSGPILDALCLSVLKEQPESGEEYGDQRLWSAFGWAFMGLVAGYLVDIYGTSSIFFCFAALVTANTYIICRYMPAKKRTSQAPAGDAPTARLLDVLKSKEAVWLFVNLMVYGNFMALVESYLNVFLVEEFLDVPMSLLGMATFVMCMCEIPVFKYVSRLWNGGKGSIGLVNALLAAELLLSVRCVLYAYLPREHPWLVLFVQPLHGITHSMMWSATVECARRLAKPGTEAKMQALVNGLFYQISYGFGSFLWGMAVLKPPAGLGFSRCFMLDAGLVVVWFLIARLSWMKIRKSATYFS